MNTAIVGINWGDEGKGRMVDLLSENFDVVVRYQGGNNAGHTVINEKGKFVLNLLPSGILRDGVVNVMGPGMVIDIKHFSEEVQRLADKGVSVTPENLKVSDRAVICMPYHVQQDIMEEDRLADKKAGSTRRGIGPVYADKYFRKAFKTGDLLYSADLYGKVRDICEWKNIQIAGYGKTIDVDETYYWLMKYGDIIKPFVCDTGELFLKAQKEGKKVLFEAQLGALRDIDLGIYPYTSSSSTIAAYAPIGAGAPFLKIDKTVGIVKAYSSAVGGGPFVCEMSGKAAEALREAGGEYGAATGRPRRVGPLDIPATEYGVRVQGADEIVVTKLDILSYMDKIPVCVAYERNGEIYKTFPYPDLLDGCKPVIEYKKGWKCDISAAKTLDDLPKEARSYLRYIQKTVGAKITYVSVGAERDSYIKVSGRM
ncbi:MAG: adenylosuccinate synthase [Clostridiaceae bacterium]|jgi:adenylosuccinate synthase|nr:adenylosuccinate synthase [Clostridiaceae bacterium]